MQSCGPPGIEFEANGLERSEESLVYTRYARFTSISLPSRDGSHASSDLFKKPIGLSFSETFRQSDQMQIAT